MQPDTLSVVLRSLSFIALFQAAGMVLFLAMFGRSLNASLAFLGRIAMLSAIAAITLLVGQYLLEAARMADDWSGIFDASMQKMVLHSAPSTVLAMRCLGLSILVLAIGFTAGLGHMAVASGIATVIVLALAEKTRIHAMLARIEEVELRAALQFAALALVVLPLLPSGPFGPWGGDLISTHAPSPQVCPAGQSIPKKATRM